jgi:hypothetical protein
MCLQLIGTFHSQAPGLRSLHKTTRSTLTTGIISLDFGLLYILLLLDCTTRYLFLPFGGWCYILIDLLVCLLFDHLFGFLARSFRLYRCFLLSLFDFFFLFFTLSSFPLCALFGLR